MLKNVCSSVETRVQDIAEEALLFDPSTAHSA